MKWFWYSLIGFALLMCSCKSKKVIADFHEKTNVNSELSAYHNVATIDTTRLLHTEDLKQIITIDETITTKKYDKDTGAITEETETKRKVVKDIDKATTEEEIKGESIATIDSLNHSEDIIEMVDSKTEEESIGGQESFGKWLGIVLGIGIVVGIIILIIYIRKKLKVSKSLFRGTNA